MIKLLCTCCYSYSN